MSTGRNVSPLSATGEMGLPIPLHAQLRGGSAAMDWLAPMILAVRTVAAGAEFIPLPYIRAAFGTVVVFLETVDVGRRILHGDSLTHYSSENEEKSGRFAGVV